MILSEKLVEPAIRQDMPDVHEGGVGIVNITASDDVVVMVITAILLLVVRDIDRSFLEYRNISDKSQQYQPTYNSCLSNLFLLMITKLCVLINTTRTSKTCIAEFGPNHSLQSKHEQGKYYHD